MPTHLGRMPAGQRILSCILIPRRGYVNSPQKDQPVDARGIGDGTQVRRLSVRNISDRVTLSHLRQPQRQPALLRDRIGAECPGSRATKRGRHDSLRYGALSLLEVRARRRSNGWKVDSWFM
jgi:hypothetical protein